MDAKSMDGKSKRGRGWGANDKLIHKGEDKKKTFPEWKEIYDTAGKVKKAKFEAMIEWLYQYARDMHTWGQDVRDDIIRLEGRAGFASGDPGDPPDGPPKGDEEE